MNHVPEIVAAASAGLIALGIFVILPIVNMVFRHQKELAGRNLSAPTDQRIAALEAEVKELRDRVNDHTLKLDGRPHVPEEVSQRLR